MKIAVSLVALGALSLSVAGVARAQPPDVQPAPYPPPTQASPYYVGAEQVQPPAGVVPAPANAFEIQVGTGYTQGFGNLRSGTGLPSVVSPGGAVDLGLGYRIDPHWEVGFRGEYAQYVAERSNVARAFTTGIAFQYHAIPFHKVDPFLEVGAGYRVLIEHSDIGPDLYTHGFQLARVRVGVDFRVDKDVALGPVIGGDATMFLFQDFPNLQTNISNPTVSTFVFAGLQGRFDIGGRTTTGQTPTLTSAAIQ